MVQMMSEVHTAICGDEKWGHRGLIKRVLRLEYIALVAVLLFASFAGEQAFGFVMSLIK